METWHLKPSAVMPQFLCFSDSHFFILLWPLFHGLSLCGCVTLPLFLKVFVFLLPLSEGLRDLPSDFVPFWAMLEPVLFCAFRLVTRVAFTLMRPTNVEESFLHPSSLQKSFSCYSSMFFFSPLFLRLLPQQGQSWLQPNSCFAAHFFQ